MSTYHTPKAHIEALRRKVRELKRENEALREGIIVADGKDCWKQYSDPYTSLYVTSTGILNLQES